MVLVSQTVCPQPVIISHWLMEQQVTISLHAGQVVASFMALTCLISGSPSLWTFCSKLAKPFWLMNGKSRLKPQATKQKTHTDNQPQSLNLKHKRPSKALHSRLTPHTTKAPSLG